LARPESKRDCFFPESFPVNTLTFFFFSCTSLYTFVLHRFSRFSNVLAPKVPQHKIWPSLLPLARAGFGCSPSPYLVSVPFFLRTSRLRAFFGKSTTYTFPGFVPQFFAHSLGPSFAVFHDQFIPPSFALLFSF